MFDRRHPVIFSFKPGSVIFPGRCRPAFFSISTGESYFFFRGWLMFSLPYRWKHAGVGRNTTSVELERKNLADLHYKFYGNTEQKSILYRKKILSASVCKKKLRNVGRKISVATLQRPMSVIVILFNPWIIFGWCLIGKVRSATSGDASFLNLHRWSFLIHVS